MHFIDFVIAADHCQHDRIVQFIYHRFDRPFDRQPEVIADHFDRVLARRRHQFFLFIILISQGSVFGTTASVLAAKSQCRQ